MNKKMIESSNGISKYYESDIIKRARKRQLPIGNNKN